MTDFHGAARTAAPAQRSMPTRRPVLSGPHAVGRITRLLVGQGYGYIRLADEREIYFHRADVSEGTSINDLRLGDSVAFELLEDHVSGPRALQVKRRRRQR